MDEHLCNAFETKKRGHVIRATYEEKAKQMSIFLCM